MEKELFKPNQGHTKFIIDSAINAAINNTELTIVCINKDHANKLAAVFQAQMKERIEEFKTNIPEVYPVFVSYGNYNCSVITGAVVFDNGTLNVIFSHKELIIDNQKNIISDLRSKIDQIKRVLGLGYVGSDKRLI